MHYISLTVSALFLLALGFSLRENDMDNAIFQLIAFLILFIFFLIFWRDNKRNQDLLKWLKLNYQELRTGPMIYNGKIIDELTEFLQYEVCLSLGIVSFRRKTGFYIKGYHPTRFLHFLYTTFSFVFGWWSLPMGPINTIRTIGFNATAKPRKLSAMLSEYCDEGCPS